MRKALEREAGKTRSLPRSLYWVVGAAVALAGALSAKLLADAMPLENRLPFWLGGTVVIFIGLWIVSLGSRSRASSPDEISKDDD